MKSTTAQNPIISSDDINRLVKLQYGLREAKCRLYRKTLNSIYLIENTSLKYVFKLYNVGNTILGELKAEIELLQVLDSKGVRVAASIRDRHGEHIQLITRSTESYYGVLFTFARGKTYYNLNDEQVVIFATELARMHIITEGLQLNNEKKEYNLDTLLKSPLEKILTSFNNNIEDFTWLQQITALVGNKLIQLLRYQMSYGYCHFDLLPINFHFDEQGNITIFDFELAGRGYLINDLVSFYSHYFLLIMFNQGTKEEADRALFLLVKYYTKVKPITAIELEAFPYFGFAFWIFHLSHEHSMYDLSLGPNYIKQRLTIIKTWADWYLKF